MKTTDNSITYMLGFETASSQNITGSTMTILKLLEKELNQVGYETEIEVLDKCRIIFARVLAINKFTLTKVPKSAQFRHLSFLFLTKTGSKSYRGTFLHVRLCQYPDDNL
jgi:hypothetical protein